MAGVRAHRPRASEATGRPRRSVWALLRKTYACWSADRASRLAAALSFYTTLTLAPLLLVVISLGGMFYGPEAVRGELLRQISVLVGHDGASAIQDLLANAASPSDSLLASLVGVVTLLFGAAGVAWELKEALNKIWDVPVDDSASTPRMIASYFVSLALVLGIGFILVVSLVVSAGLAAMNGYVASLLPGSEMLWMAVNFLVSLGAMTLFFALMFKLLPDTEVRLRDVWSGALVTAVFFEVGKLLVGFYLGQAAIASAYGAAGSFVIVLLWIYYAAQIVFFGAEFAHVVATPEAKPSTVSRA